MPFPFASSKPPKLYAAWEDDALVQALGRGDKLAFAEIYERYWFQLYEVAYRKLHSREGAEEIVQDLFTALWHKRHENRIDKLPHYLFSAVRYRVIDLFKSRSLQDNYFTYSHLLLPSADRCTEEEVAADDLAVALKASLQRMPAHTQQVFRLSRLEHQSVPEIAVQLNISHKTVEYHLTRALKFLRISLKDFLVILVILLI